MTTNNLPTIAELYEMLEQVWGYHVMFDENWNSYPVKTTFKERLVNHRKLKEQYADQSGMSVEKVKEVLDTYVYNLEKEKENNELLKRKDSYLFRYSRILHTLTSLLEFDFAKWNGKVVNKRFFDSIKNAFENETYHIRADFYETFLDKRKDIEFYLFFNENIDSSSFVAYNVVDDNKRLIASEVLKEIERKINLIREQYDAMLNFDPIEAKEQKNRIMQMISEHNKVIPYEFDSLRVNG